MVVFGLFISAPETQARYTSPQLLWLVAIGLVYWMVLQARYDRRAKANNTLA